MPTADDLRALMTYVSPGSPATMTPIAGGNDVLAHLQQLAVIHNPDFGPSIIPIRHPTTGKIVFLRDVDSGALYPYDDPEPGRFMQVSGASLPTAAANQAVAPTPINQGAAGAAQQMPGPGPEAVQVSNLPINHPLRQQMASWLETLADLKNAGLQRDPLTRNFESELGVRVRDKMRDVWRGAMTRRREKHPDEYPE